MTAEPAERSTMDKIKDEAQEASHWTPVSYGKALLARFSRDHTTILAAGVAYNLVFALPPLLIFLLTMAAVTDHFTGVQVAQRLHDAITQHAPANTQDLLNQLVTRAISEANGAAVSIGAAVTIVLAFYGASGAVSSLKEAFNMAYGVKDSRSFFKQKGIVFGLTILFVVVSIVGFVLFVFGKRIGLAIASNFGLGSTFSTIWNIARWPAAIILFLVLLTLLYSWGPDVDHPLRRVWPGAAAATVLWVVAMLGFRLYVGLSNPGSAYGAAGSVIVLLFFLYLTGLILILGVQINAVLQSRREPEAGRDVAAHHADLATTGAAPPAQPAPPSSRQAPDVPPPSSRAFSPPAHERRHGRLGLGILIGGLASLALGALARARSSKHRA